MWIAATGACLSTVCLIWLATVNIFSILKYFTNWMLVLELITLSMKIFSIDSKKLRPILIVVWSLGWQVSILFWFYVYPLLTPEQAPPMWFNILSHGGVHLCVSKVFYDSNIQVKSSDFKYPVSVSLAYFALVVIPLKLLGITIYPLFLVSFFPTLLIVSSSLLVTYLSFLTINLLHTQSKSN